MICKTCKYPYAVKGNCPNCGSTLPQGITPGNWLLIMMAISAVVGLTILISIKKNRVRREYDGTTSLQDTIGQSTQPHSMVADSSVQIPQVNETAAPSEASANASYTCRECGKEIPWIGSYRWTIGPDSYSISQNEDASLEGDDRINTSLYSEEGYYSRGIFCSNDCAQINGDAFDYDNP